MTNRAYHEVRTCMRKQMTGNILKPVNGSTVSLHWPFELVNMLGKRQQLGRLGDIVDSDHKRPLLFCGVGCKMGHLQS